MTGRTSCSKAGCEGFALLVAGHLLGGCAEPRPPDPAPVVWEGEHLEFATHGSVDSCGGSLTFLDTFIGLAGAEMGLSLDAPVRYYLLSGRELTDLDFCPPGTACVFERFVYTSNAVNTHEATHATRHIGLGSTLPGLSFFEEGIAELYDLQPLYVDAERDVHAGLQAAEGLRGRLPFEFYGVAGDFVRFLEIEHGIEAVSDSLAAMRPLDNLEQLEPLFVEHFDESLDSAIARYREDYPVCSDFARARHVVECAQEPLSFVDGRIDVEYELSCEDPNVIGPIDGRMMRSFTFTLDEPERLFFFAPRPESPWELPPCPSPFEVEVIDCDRGCLSDVDLHGPDEDDISPLPNEGDDLPPGRYLVRLSRAVDEPGPACITVDDSPPEY